MWNRRDVLASAKNRPGVAMWMSSSATPGNMACYVTEDHGATVTKKFTGRGDTLGDTDQFYEGKIEHLYTSQTSWIYAYGGFDRNPHVMRSDDDGTSWAHLRGSTVSYVQSFSQGAAPPGGTLPILWLVCTVGGVPGVYYSLDLLATDPVLVSGCRYPDGELQFLSKIAGDRNVWNRAYVVRSGAGYQTVDLLDVATGS